MSPCLHRSYSCGTVSPTCKVGLGQLHVYIDELLRGNLQKRERLGGEPTLTPLGRLEPGSLGIKGETRRRANADAMREARARESREEGETRRRAIADARREARARESREGETRRRANADAMREARARPIALPLSVQELLLFTPQRTHQRS